VPVGEGREPVKLQVVGASGATRGQSVILSVRPEDISLHLNKPNGPSTGNLLKGEVIDTVYLGNFLECRVQVGAHELGIQLDHFEQLQPKQPVFLTFQPDHALCLTE
jgi:ABC-type sugar transport system ATPase subunit